jgi:hypothetical protein
MFGRRERASAMPVIRAATLEGEAPVSRTLRPAAGEKVCPRLESNQHALSGKRF